MRREVFQQLLHRRADSYKYDYGHVLVVGGSPGMVGAPLLVGRAALRVGAGLVSIASSTDVADKLERRVEEVMTLALSLNPVEATETIRNFIKDRRASVLVAGPGLNKQSEELVRNLVKSINLPMVIDGGGLAALIDHLEILKKSVSKNIVLTPHLGEFGRFFNKALPTKREDLKPIAQKFAKDNQVMLVLKGQPTFVAHPDGKLYVNNTGGPGLATAGTGDVLSGMIGGIIAQGIEPKQAVEAAVYLHGLAGDIAAKEKTEPGLIASDVIEAIPYALKTVG